MRLFSPRRLWHFRGRARPARPAPARLRLEELEGRLAPATFTVSNVNDSGAGSLRQAILDNDATGTGPNLIQFAIPGAGVHFIEPTSPEPTVSTPAFIDGATQPGFVQANAPQIVLGGLLVGVGPTQGLVLTSNGCTVRGLAINNFGNAGVLVESNGNLIVSNYLGTDATGTVAAANQFGVRVIGSSANNVIENNLLSGNGTDGVSLENTTSGTVLQFNLIGTDISGTRLLGNRNLGVVLSGNTTGNRLAANVISGNGLYGVELASCSGDVVANNLIGTDSSGTRPLPNSVGVILASTSAETFQSNVISGNTGVGLLGAPGNSRTLLLSNLVGVDLSGERALGNGSFGIELDASTNGVVAGNTVAANAGGGIVLDGSSGNVLAGNRVGTDASGTLAAGNGGRAGVELLAKASNNVIDNNLISGNLQDGVYVLDAGTTGNRIQRNLIGVSAGNTPLPNGLHGVEVANGAANNTLQGNDVLFNRGHGIVLRDSGTVNTSVYGNNSSFNAGAGLLIANGADDTAVGTGAIPGFGNTFALNGQAGVWADGPTTFGVDLSGNAIFGNAGLGGIALTHGANGGYVVPTLVYAVSTSQGMTTVAGTLHAAANNLFSLDFFDNPSGGGQGQVFVGFNSVTTDAGGDAAFAFDFPGALTSVTTTATVASAHPSTGLFSAPVAVVRL
jgi:titin